MTQSLTLRFFCMIAATCSLGLPSTHAQERKEEAVSQQNSDVIDLVEELHLQWSDASFKVRAGASEKFLGSLPFQYLSLCEELIKKSAASGAPEIRVRTEEILKTIYRRAVLGEGPSQTGLTLGWFIDMHNGLPTSYPLVLEVAEESPAQQGGFVRGDVILAMNGEFYQSVESRNLLIRKLGEIPPNTELVFQVKNSTKDRDVAYDKYHKDWRGVRKLVTTQSEESEQKTEFKEKEYLTWRGQLSQR